jgi:hypothetical protein
MKPENIESLDQIFAFTLRKPVESLAKKAHGLAETPGFQKVASRFQAPKKRRLAASVRADSFHV